MLVKKQMGFRKGTSTINAIEHWSKLDILTNSTVTYHMTMTVTSKTSE